MNGSEIMIENVLGGRLLMTYASKDHRRAYIDIEGILNVTKSRFPDWP